VTTQPLTSRATLGTTGLCALGDMAPQRPLMSATGGARADLDGRSVVVEGMHRVLDQLDRAADEVVALDREQARTPRDGHIRTESIAVGVLGEGPARAMGDPGRDRVNGENRWLCPTKADDGAAVRISTGLHADASHDHGRNHSTKDPRADQA
jgi:hypothetical protein